MTEIFKRILIVDDQGSRRFKARDLEKGFQLLGVNVEVSLVNSPVKAIDQLHLWHSQGFKADILSADWFDTTNSFGDEYTLDVGSIQPRMAARYLDDFWAKTSGPGKKGPRLLEALTKFSATEFGEDFLPEQVFVYSAEDGKEVQINGDVHRTIDDNEFSDIASMSEIKDYMGYVGSSRTTALHCYLNENWGIQIPISDDERENFDLETLNENSSNVESPRTRILSMDEAVKVLKAEELSELDILHSRIKLPSYKELNHTELAEFPSCSSMVFGNDGVEGAVSGRLALSEEDIDWIEENHPKDKIIFVTSRADDVEPVLSRIHGMGILESDIMAKHLKVLAEQYDMPLVLCDSTYSHVNEEDGLSYPRIEKQQLLSYLGGMVRGIKAREFATLEIKDFFNTRTNEQETHADIHEGYFEVKSHMADLEHFKPVLNVYDWARGQQQLRVAANAQNADQVIESIRAGADGVDLVRPEKWPKDDATKQVLSEVLISGEVTEQAQAVLKSHYKSNLLEMLNAIEDAPDNFTITFRAPDYNVLEIMQSHQSDEVIARVGVENSRGVQLAIQTNGLYESFVEAFFEAVKEAKLPLDRAKLLIPMLMSEHEVVAFREITERFGDGQVVEIGGMNENPAFLANAEEISKHIDFWSAGTNDLTENAMGNVDRNDIQAKEHWMRANEQTGKDPTLSLCDLVKDELVASKEAVGKELKSSICGQQVAGDMPSIQFAAEHGFGVSVPPSYIEYTRLVVGQIACSKVINAGTPKNELGLKLQIP